MRWILFILPFLLPAQGYSQGDQFTLQELIEHGLKHNKQLQAQRLEVKAKTAEIGPSSSLDDPMLSFEAMNYPTDTWSTGKTGMTGRQLWLSQKIPFPGKLGAKEDMAQAEAQRENHFEKAKELEVVRDIKILYANVYLAHRRKDILEDQRTLIEKTLKVARSKYTTGTTSQADVLNLQVEYGKLTDKILEAQKSIDTLNAEIIHHLGGVSEFENKRPAPLPRTDLSVQSLDYKNLLGESLTNNPAIHAMHSEREARDHEKSYAKKGYLPDFEIGVGYTLRNPSLMDNGVDFASVKIGISIPLWAGSKQSEEIRAASFRESKAEVMVENEKIHIERAVRVSFSELNEADKRLELFETSLLPLATQASQSSRAAYLAGKLDFSTFIQALSTQFETELSREEALVKRENRIAELEAILGRNIK